MPPAKCRTNSRVATPGPYALQAPQILFQDLARWVAGHCVNQLYLLRQFVDSHALLFQVVVDFLKGRRVVLIGRHHADTDPLYDVVRLRYTATSCTLSKPSTTISTFTLEILKPPRITMYFLRSICVASHASRKDTLFHIAHILAAPLQEQRGKQSAGLCQIVHGQLPDVGQLSHQ